MPNDPTNNDNQIDENEVDGAEKENLTEKDLDSAAGGRSRNGGNFLRGDKIKKKGAIDIGTGTTTGALEWDTRCSHSISAC